MAATNSGFFKQLGKKAAPYIIACSIAAVPFIKQDEGRILVPYLDIAGIATDCDGNTVNVVMTRNRTHEECDKLTEAAALKYGNALAKRLEVVPPEKTFMALVRWSYNIGTGAAYSSSAMRLINQGKIAEGCRAMMRFACYTVGVGKGEKDKTKQCYSPSTNFNKAFSKGLYNRRKRESDMCLAGLSEK